MMMLKTTIYIVQHNRIIIIICKYNKKFNEQINMANKIMTKPASHEEIIIIIHHHHYRMQYYCQLCILNINYINKYIKK